MKYDDLCGSMELLMCLSVCPSVHTIIKLASHMGTYQGGDNLIQSGTTFRFNIYHQRLVCLISQRLIEPETWDLAQMPLASKGSTCLILGTMGTPHSDSKITV